MQSNRKKSISSKKKITYMSKFWSNSDDSSSSSEESGSVCWDESDGSVEANHVFLGGGEQENDALDPNNDPFCTIQPNSTPTVSESFSAKKALETTEDPSKDANLIWEQIKGSQVFEEVPTVDASIPKPSDHVRIVLISDTHSKHRDIPFLPAGDVLVHGGDFTKSGEKGTVEDFSMYLAEHEKDFKRIICIAGNHELTFHSEFYPTAKRRHKPKPFEPEETRAALKNCTYLEDSGTTIGKDNSIEVYGSPWTPQFYDRAFNLPRGEALNEIWSKVPSSTDFLISHGPPLGRGDFTDHSGRSGDYELLKHVQDRIKPRLHAFGHIHQAHGVWFDGHTVFCNASSLDSDTLIASRPPIVVDLPLDKSLSVRVVKPSCKLKILGELLDWLETNNYSKILDCAPREDSTRTVPLPDAFSSESSFFDLCGILNLYRNETARAELQLRLANSMRNLFIELQQGTLPVF